MSTGEVSSYKCADCGHPVTLGTQMCPGYNEPMEWDDHELRIEGFSEASKPRPWFDRNDRWGKDQQVVDDSAPKLYSKRAIYTFSFVFSVVFGAVLMAINLRELKKTQYIVPTLSFAITFIGTFLWITDVVETRYGVSLATGNLIPALGALLILRFTWDRFIGREVRYQKRGIVIPLIVGLGLLFSILAVIVWVSKHA